MTRAIRVAFGVVLIGLVVLAGTGRLQDAQGQSAQDQRAQSQEAPPDSAQEREIQRLRQLVGHLQEQLATYLLQDQQAQKVDELQTSYEQAVQQQRSVQDEVKRIEAERLKAVAELEKLRATQTEQQQEQNLRQAEFTRLQQLVVILQDDLTETRRNLQEARQTETAARAESQRWQVLHGEAHQAQTALQEELKNAQAKAQVADEQIETQTEQRVQAALTKRQDEFIALEQEIARLSSAQESSLAALKELQEGKAQQLEKALQELAEVQGQLQATQAESAHVQEQLSETQQQYAAATKTQQALQLQIAELEPVRASVEALTSERNTFAGQLTQVRSQLNVAETESVQWREQYGEVA
ncbi:MAG: hypothetical protein OEU26_07505, partial [Candidatus Tectomicrobia bacterium]|nr:hypothetical protein [Candidatus Tectomicrobia bacterium]